jgi:hypothetical protein
MPVRRTKTIAEKTRREDMGLRPAPALRWYLRSGSRLRTGISGSTLLHKLSETVQDLIWDMLNPSSPNPADSKQQICPKESTPSLFTDKFLARLDLIDFIGPTKIVPCYKAMLMGFFIKLRAG